MVLLKWQFIQVSTWDLVSDSLITSSVQLDSRCCVHVKTQKRPLPTTVMAPHGTTSPAASDSLLSVGPCTNREETALVCNYAGIVSSQSLSIRCRIGSYAIKHQKLAGWLISGKTMPKKDPADLYLSLPICISFYRAKFCKKIPGCGDHSWTTGCSTDMLWKTALIHVYSLLLWQWTCALG